MSLHLEITTDNKLLLQKVEQAQGAIQTLQRQAQETGLSLEHMWAKGSAPGLGAVSQMIQQFASAIISTRAELEGMEIAIASLVGSSDQASLMMTELQEIASSSPLDLSTLAQSTEHLLSVGVASDKVIPLLRQLGDVSGGDNERLGALAMAFAQVSASGQMTEQSLREMISAGFNPLGQMAQDTGISVTGLYAQMEQGSVSVEMLERALTSATSEGGIYFEHLKEQSAGLRGSIGKLSSAWSNMLSEIGQSNQGLITSGYDLATSLVSNYKAIGEAVLELSASYGVYKAAQAALVSIPSALEGLGHLASLEAETRALSELAPMQAQEALSKRGLISGTAEYASALKEEVAALRDSALGKAQDLAQAEILARREYGDSLRRHLGAKERLRSATSEVAAAQQTLRAQAMLVSESEREALQRSVTTAITEAQTAKTELNTAALGRNVASKRLASIEAQRRAALSTAESASLALDTAATASNTAAKSLGAKVTTLLTQAMTRLNAVLMANKFTLVAAGIAAVGYGLYRWITMARGAQAAQEDFDASMQEHQQGFNERRNDIQQYVASLQDASKTDTQKLEAWEKLIELAPELKETYTQQTLAMSDQTEVALELNRVLEEQELLALKRQAHDATALYNAFKDGRHMSDKQLDSKYGAGMAQRVEDERRWLSSDGQDQERLKEQARLAEEAYNKRLRLHRQAEANSQKEATTLGTVSERLRALSATIIATESQLQALRQSGSQATQGQIAQAEGKLKDAKAQYQALSGEDYDAQKARIKQQREEARQRALEQQREQLRQQGELVRLGFEIEESQIMATKQGAERRMALIELEHHKRLALIEQDKKEMEVDAQQKGQGGKLTSEQQDILAKRIALETARHQAEHQAHRESEERAQLEMLQSYGSYLEKRQAMKALADLEMAQAETEVQRKAIQARLLRETAALDMEVGNRQGAMARLYGSMAGKSAQGLEAIAQEGDQLVSYIRAGKHQEGNAYGITAEMMQTFQDDPDKLQAITTQIEAVRKSAYEAKNPLGQLSEGIQELFASGGDKDKVSKAIDKIRQGMDKTSAAIKFVSSNLSAIGEATGSGALKGIATGLGEVTGAMDAMSQGAQAGAAFGPIGQAAGAALGFVSALSGTISKLHDKKHDKRIRELAGEVETLGKSYDKLSREVERAYSSEAVRLASEQEQLLRQKQAALRSMADEEEKKKKADHNKVKEYRKQAEEIDQQIALNKEKARDALFGKDLRSAIDEFANAYAEAWSSGNDRAQASKEFVKRQIKGMVMELIKMQAKPHLEQLRQSLVDAWADGFITAAEQQSLDRLAEGISRHIDKQTEQHRRFLEGQGMVEAPTASRGGFEAMSQETGHALEGRFTAMHEAQLRLVEVGRSSLSVLEEARSLMVSSIGHLERIAGNTNLLAQIDERLSSIERNTRELR